MSDVRAVIGTVWKIESARIVGSLARYTGDFALAEDLTQEAIAEALVTWSRGGLPDNPAAWLMAVGRRRAIDTFRRRSARSTSGTRRSPTTWARVRVPASAPLVLVAAPVLAVPPLARTN